MSLRLFAMVIVGEAHKLLSYRADFWINAVLVFFVEFGVAYYVWSAVFDHTEATTIGGFTRDGMITYYVIALLLGKLVLGHPRDFTIASDIYEGGLTRYLIYPVSYFWFKYAEHLGVLIPAVVRLALCGCVAMVVFADTPKLEVTPIHLAEGVVSLAVATLLHFLILFVLESVAFWADNTWTLIVSFNFSASLLGGLLLPLELFPARLEPLLDALPFRHLVHAPITVVLGQTTTAAWAYDLASALGWCAGLAILARVMWRRGTHRYTGVGI